MPEVITLKCPFCKKKVIRMRPGKEVYTTQRIMVGSNRKTVPRLHRTEDMVLVAKCPNCGKTKKEIEKALKEGIPPSREEIIRRAKEAGLPLIIKG